MSFNDDHAIETYKSLITISGEAVRALLLLNGGAVVALLAYLGQAKTTTGLVHQAACSLGWFVAGLVVSVLAFLGSYMTQLTLYQESVHSKPKDSHVKWLRMSMATALLSLGAFAVGAFVGVRALAQ